MRPGDQVISCQPSAISDQVFVCATKNAEGQIAVNILNTGEATSFPLQIGEYCATVDMPANSVETILVKL